MGTTMRTSNLNSIATEIRKNLIKMIYHAKSGHPGGSLSCVELLTVLYFNQLRVNPEKPKWENRDRFVLSKGHACPALYAALALKGFFPVKDLLGLRKVDHYLEGHPDVRIPGIDAPSGSLGMGLSQALGMALGARYLNRDYKAYVILGDGDMEEGNTWEAIMAAGHHKIDNLIAILDSNKLQGDDLVENQMNYFPVVEKLKSFKWDVVEIDGHDYSQITEALARDGNSEQKPLFILAHTVKGKGIAFMENQQFWHGSVTLSDDDLNRSMEKLLGEQYETIIH